MWSSNSHGLAGSQRSTESLIERQNHEDEIDEPWIYDSGLEESDFDDNEYNFSCWDNNRNTQRKSS